MKVTKYVVGFAIWRNKVLLIHKKRGPPYVIGKLNGVGGKIEDKENVAFAMAREFQEETGVETWPNLWNWVCTMRGDDYDLNVFYSFLPDVTDFSAIKNPEQKGEDLQWIDLDNLGNYNIVENLKWLIPLCFDSTTPFLEICDG
jgi:8-oxo-dGTP diphosphatase